MRRALKNPTIFAWLFALATFVLAPSVVRAEPYDLQELLKEAMQNNNNLKAAAHESNSKEYERRSIFGRFLPVLRAEVNAFAWNDKNEYEFDMSGLGMALANVQGFDPSGMSNPILNIRDDVTIGTSLMVIQPLMQLYKIYYGHEATYKMAAAAKKDEVSARHKLQGEISNAYFSHIGARQMSETVKAALKQVDAYEKMTQDYLDAGLMERDALLKVQVQRAEMQKALFQTEKGIKLTRSLINMYLGRPLETPLEIRQGEYEKAVADLQATLDNLQEEGIQSRPELQSARLQRTAAKDGKNAAIGDMLPEINAMFSYQNSQGMGDFTPENQFFGGVMLKWNFWERGATYYQVRAAEEKAAKAERMVAAGEDGIRLDIEQKWLEYKEAIQQENVAKAQWELAKENMRIEQDRYEVQQTTATDLLDAHTKLLKAENDHTVAAVKVRAARNALLLAAGRDLLEENS